MEWAVVLEYPGMQHLFCIWHVKENIKKMLHSKLEDSFDEFYSKFWQCRNADTLHGFEYYWGQFISFPNARLYLECYLYKCRFSWACAFTVTAFTLGIQSTSFVESQNACIKRVLESSNTSLYELGKVLMERNNEEQKRKQFEEWKHGTLSSTIVVTIFPAIESLVKCYLRLNVSHFLIEQMKKSLYYMASHSTVEEVESLIICELSQSKDMDGELDAVNLSAKCLLDRLERNTIEEIWKLSRVTSSKINHFVFLLSNSLYSYMCPLQQKKGLVCWHFYYLLNITEKLQFSLCLIAKR
ncbi:8650_t:CDS:1 [Cetraspora pellucida]|uniref:8650_t:CDS:1 n=1 Tax=Cetraspora pellucida TaxID=1433469 RepID=A0A9N9DCL1_9GLOM|nr:8650_t:CDS:1 [Cetraspora pellucida]